ncbi:MAG: DUF523 domain-containing protein [Bacillota bacterium]|nr:DUF523 domain-containing protein [Bacillota bacterium]
MIMLSACLAGVDCRYDGGHNLRPHYKQLWQDGRAILVCPESLGGLCIPRPPAEITGGDGHDVLAGHARVKNRQGTDITEAFLHGAEKVLQLAKKHRVTAALLKERSPSCGATRIYDGTFSGAIRYGMGVTAALLQQNGIAVYSEENHPEL